MTPQDIWTEVGMFMKKSGTDVFERIFRSNAEIALRNEFQCYLRAKQPGWFTIPEYKMKNGSLGTTHREAGDLAIIDAKNIVPISPPDCIVECKHFSSLQKEIVTHITKNGKRLSMAADCWRELDRWGGGSVLHLNFFTSIISAKNIKAPLNSSYSFLDTYVGKINIPPLVNRDFDSLRHHFVNTLNRSVATIESEINTGSSSVVFGLQGAPLKRNVVYYLANSRICISSEETSMQTIKLSSGGVIEGKVSVIGVWKTNQNTDEQFEILYG